MESVGKCRQGSPAVDLRLRTLGFQLVQDSSQFADLTLVQLEFVALKIAAVGEHRIHRRNLRRPFRRRDLPTNGESDRSPSRCVVVDDRRAGAAPPMEV